MDKDKFCHLVGQKSQSLGDKFSSPGDILCHPVVVLKDAVALVKALQLSLVTEVDSKLLYPHMSVSASAPVLRFTLRDSPYTTTRAPFTRQRSGLPHELAHCVRPRCGQLANVAMLSLMRRARVYVALPSSRMNSSAPLMGSKE